MIEVFSVTNVVESDERLVVSGRAYTDIGIGDTLSVSPAGEPVATVAGIISYGKRTDLLSRMMTGSLELTLLVRKVPSGISMLYGEPRSATV